MTRHEFITTATLLGYVDEDKMKAFVRAADKTEFSDEDYIELYRANPDRSYTPYFYRLDVVKVLQVMRRV